MILKLIKNTWFVWILLSIVTVYIYGGTTSYDILYNYDDDAYLEQRITDLNGKNVKEYFSDYYLGMYQPVPVLTYAVVFHFFPGSVKAQRIINIGLHCINLLLIIIFLRSLTANRYIACLTAILVAIHPMNVEFITWFSTRSNLMYAFFYLSSLILCLRWVRNQTWLNWGVMFLSFLAAMFCKVTAATFPFLAILLQWYSGKKFDLRSILLYLPLFTVSSLFIFIGIGASSAFGHISDLGIVYSFSDRIFILLHAIWLYIGKAILPIHQSVIYLYPWKVGGHIPVSYIITGILVIIIMAAIAITAWKNRKKETGKAIIFGSLFFMLVLSIVLPLRWSRTILIAERYTYLPYVGLFAGIFMALFSISLKKWVRITLLSVFGLIVLVFTWMAHERTKVWETPVTLFTDVIENNRSEAEVSMGYYNRGNEYFRRKEVRMALADYSEALRINPRYAEAWFNSGLARFSVKDYQGALREFSQAITYKKDYVKAYVNRGTTYRLTGMYPEALADYNRALSINRFPLAYFNRGILFYFHLNDPYQACSDWKEALYLGYEGSRELLDKYCR